MILQYFVVIPCNTYHKVMQHLPHYSNTLQTTSYNFTKTKTTKETCVGIVKAAAIHKKNPEQHFTDLKFLESQNELQHVFRHNGSPKSVECIRVDSGCDEAITREEVQFLWTQRHIERGTKMTFVTTRHSGGSNLNRVELQNGCET